MNKIIIKKNSELKYYYLIQRKFLINIFFNFQKEC